MEIKVGRHWIHQSTLASTWGVFQKYLRAHNSVEKWRFKSSQTTHFSIYGVWVSYFVCNFKEYLWNSTQNILPIQWKIQILYNVENWRALRFTSSNVLLKRMPSSLLLWIKWHSKVILGSFSYNVYRWLSLRLWLLHCKHMKLPQSCAGPLILSYITTLFYHVNFKWGEKMIIYSIFSPQWNSYNDKTTFCYDFVPLMARCSFIIVCSEIVWIPM